MIIKTSPLRFFGLIMALAFFSCLMLAGPGADLAEADGSSYPAQIFIDATPTLNHAGTVSGTTVTYITSNGVPRTVFIADGLEKEFKEPVAVYLNTSVLYNLYGQGAVN